MERTSSFQTPNFHLNREVKSEETYSVRAAEQCFEKESQQSGNEWQSSALASPMTTLNRDAVPIGDDIESVGESRVDVETGYEEESLEEGIPTFEARRAEQE